MPLTIGVSQTRGQELDLSVVIVVTDEDGRSVLSMTVPTDLATAYADLLYAAAKSIDNKWKDNV